MKQIDTLEDAFIYGLADIYNAEQQLVRALPKLAKASDNEELSKGFEQHLEETEGQIERIEEVLDILDIELPRMRCDAMAGLVQESQDVINEMQAGPLRDVLLIAGGQKVEHYEIAAYGCLVEWAKQLGHDDVAEILKETLDEEKATDEKLNQIAVSAVNEQAEEAAA